MDCPKCLGKLQKKKIEGIEVDSCFVCEGIWFDAGELEEVLKRDTEDIDIEDINKPEFDAKEAFELIKDLDAKPGKCPRCTTPVPLVPNFYKNGKVRVDACPENHGVWLDGGEIHKLRELWKKNFRAFLRDIKSFFTRK